MKVKHNEIFPLTMSVYTPDYKITEQEIEFLKNLEYREEGYDTSGHVITKDLDILERHPELKNIRNVMLKVAEQYKKDVFGISNELAPLYNWSAKQYEGCHMSMHQHYSALFNLVYYIKGSENAGALKCELRHHDSRLQEGFNFLFSVEKTTSMNSPTFAHFPRDGEIVCLPGWLNHGTEPCTGFRMVIGWNFFVNGIMGNEATTDVVINVTSQRRKD